MSLRFLMLAWNGLMRHGPPDAVASAVTEIDGDNR